MAATVSNADLVELGVHQHPAHRILATGGATIDTYTGKVHRRILRCSRFDPGDAVREACIAEVLPADIVESLGTLAGSHTIDLHHDEAQVCNRLQAIERPKLLWHMGIVRSGIDLFNDRILQCLAIVAWPMDNAIDGCLAITAQ